MHMLQQVYSEQCQSQADIRQHCRFQSSARLTEQKLQKSYRFDSLQRHSSVGHVCQLLCDMCRGTIAGRPYLAHLESVTKLALVASICAPPSRRHTSLEGRCELPLLGAQLPHVIQVGTQAG